MEVLDVGALDEADARRDAVVRRRGRLHRDVLGAGAAASACRAGVGLGSGATDHPGQRVRAYEAVVEARVRVAPEQVVPRFHVLHTCSVELGDEPQPDGELVGPVVVLYLRFHT